MMDSSEIKPIDLSILNSKRRFRPRNGVSYIEPVTFNNMTDEERDGYEKMTREQQEAVLKANKDNKIGLKFTEGKFKQKKYSVEEYRQNFDCLNISLSKQEEI
mmetsp:Transcript_27872/g.26913  ORF Transcript_27872/g.26913 Transcript_27872/m.26913 type:complete len:103 (+) Transcript_27872:918-1226(+)